MISILPWLTLAARIAFLGATIGLASKRRWPIRWWVVLVGSAWTLAALDPLHLLPVPVIPVVPVIDTWAPILILALLLFELGAPAAEPVGAAGLLKSLEIDDQELGVHLSSVLEATTDLVALADDKGRVLWINGAGRRLLGLSPEEDERLLFTRDFYTEEAFRSLALESIPRARDSGTWSGEVWMRSRDGSTWPAHHVISAHRRADGAEIWSTIVRDLSAHRKAEEALRSSEAKFAAAFRHSRDSVLLTSVPAGEILEFNDGFSLITGFGRQEALGRTTRELDIWADIGERDEMFAALREKGRVGAFEAHIRNARTGAVRSCLIWGEIVEIDAQPVLLTVVRDISEQKAVEAERRRFVDDLEAKNQELERFSWTVAHDLKNPLLSIQGFVDLVEDDLGAERWDDLCLYLDRIRTSAMRMHRLLDDLLELSRAGRVIDSPRPVEMEALAHEAVELVNAGITARGARVVIRPGMGTAWGDRTRLLQVFQNLVANAAKFMGETPSPEIEIGARQGGDGSGEGEGEGETVYYVQDNGVGLDPAHHRAIFGLFDRLGARVEGTGVGLALVERIIEVHGGRVWVESEGQGQGSTFCFTLGSEEAQSRER